MRAYIKKGITHEQFEEMGIVKNSTKELLNGEHDSYHGEVDVYDGRKVFVFRDSRLPSVCWVYHIYVTRDE